MSPPAPTVQAEGGSILAPPPPLVATTELLVAPPPPLATTVAPPPPLARTATEGIRGATTGDAAEEDVPLVEDVVPFAEVEDVVPFAEVEDVVPLAEVEDVPFAELEDVVPFAELEDVPFAELEDVPFDAEVADPFAEVEDPFAEVEGPLDDPLTEDPLPLVDPAAPKHRAGGAPGTKAFFVTDPPAAPLRSRCSAIFRAQASKTGPTTGSAMYFLILVGSFFTSVYASQTAGSDMYRPISASSNKVPPLAADRMFSAFNANSLRTFIWVGRFSMKICS